MGERSFDYTQESGMDTSITSTIITITTQYSEDQLYQQKFRFIEFLFWKNIILPFD